MKWYKVVHRIDGLKWYRVGDRIALHRSPRDGRLFWHVWKTMIDVPEYCVKPD